jgi:uncharacterized membrane protein YccC
MRLGKFFRRVFIVLLCALVASSLVPHGQGAALLGDALHTLGLDWVTFYHHANLPSWTVHKPGISVHG